MEELDAIDNGVPMYAEGRPRYRISTHLSARVHRLNPEWNAADDTKPDELFTKAMEMVGKEFTERVIEVNKVQHVPFERIFSIARFMKQIIEDFVKNHFREFSSLCFCT